MKEKPKTSAPKAEELHLAPEAFDQMMRGALQVVPVKVAHAAGASSGKADRKRRK